MSDPSASEPEGQGSIRARFVVTRQQATILADFRGISVSIAWKRDGDPELAARNLRTLITNLPEVVKDGLREIFVTDQARRIDFELEELFTSEDKKHGGSSEASEPGGVEPGADPEGGLEAGQ